MAKKPKAPHIPKFSKLVKAFEGAQEIVDEEVTQFAEDERDSFVSQVEAQNFPSFNVTPLNPVYLARKLKLKLDSRVMMRTGYYINHVKVFHRRTGKRSKVIHVGFHRRALARDEHGQRTPFLLYKLAWVQERGSAKAHVPPRPHWQPHFQGMHRRAVPLRKRIKRRIRANVRKVMPGVLK